LKKYNTGLNPRFYPALLKMKIIKKSEIVGSLCKVNVTSLLDTKCSKLLLLEVPMYTNYSVYNYKNELMQFESTPVLNSRTVQSHMDTVKLNNDCCIYFQPEVLDKFPELREVERESLLTHETKVMELKIPFWSSRKFT